MNGTIATQETRSNSLVRLKRYSNVPRAKRFHSNPCEAGTVLMAFGFALNEYTTGKNNRAQVQAYHVYVIISGGTCTKTVIYLYVNMHRRSHARHFRIAWLSLVRPEREIMFRTPSALRRTACAWIRWNICEIYSLAHKYIKDYPDDAESLSPSATATGALVLTGSRTMIGWSSMNVLWKRLTKIRLGLGFTCCQTLLMVIAK